MNKKTILFIEDEEDIFEIVRYNLEKEGFKVLSAISGEVGQSKVLSHKPDLILLDLMLPGISGLELCKRLKQDENTRDIPIIMVTS